MKIVEKRMIKAPVDRVFHTVAHIEEFRKALPHIIDVEFLTESKTGVGTRFRETRFMQGKNHETELEVTEYVPNERVRLVNETKGTVWDTVFLFRQSDDVTRMEFCMEAKTDGKLAKFMNMLIKPMVSYAVSADLDRVQDYCESSDRESVSDSQSTS